MRSLLKLIIPAIAITGAVSACNPQIDEQHDNAMKFVMDDTLNVVFKAYTQRFVNDLWAHNPTWATNVGFHKYDAILEIPNDSTRATQSRFLKTQLDSLNTYEPARLAPSNKTDYLMIKNYLESEQWKMDSLKQYNWDPSQFNVTGLIAFMLNENYAPLEKRVTDCYQRLMQVPAYYSAAQQTLKDPVLELKALAIDQNKGGLYVLEKDFVDSVAKCNFTAHVKQQMVSASKEAAEAVKGYVSYLEKLNSKNARSFRLGKDLYDTKFKFEIQSTLTAKQNYEAAIARKGYLHGEMLKISRQLWPKYFGSKEMPADTLSLIGAMIDTLSSKHVKAADFQTAIEKQIPKLVQFIKDKNLLFIDSTKPLIVRKEPAYMAGVAGASINAPGPYDKQGNTYYNVGSLEGWAPEKAESYLREYNDYILQILSIHEAIPGHYTQLVYANRSPSIIKSIFGNGAMVEGWAVYTEQMMLENGYGGNQPEMWLMWYKWHLRTVCNSILDYGVHANNMSQEDAMHLLTKEAFQQQAEAEGKWKRVSVTSVQLTSYFSGYKAIYDLREKIKVKEGKNFDLRVFNEKFLSYGSAPVKYISELMLQ